MAEIAAEVSPGDVDGIDVFRVLVFVGFPGTGFLHWDPFVVYGVDVKKPPRRMAVLVAQLG